MTLSVIVPVYNTELYLERCLNSLLQQWPSDRNDYEIICVNDGSTDHSKEILQVYHAKFPHVIKVIDQENKGISATRNVGMKAANGEIITFCDSDDYLVPGGYFFLYQNIWEKTLEILRFSSITLDQYVSKNWKEKNQMSQKVLFEGNGIECLGQRNSLPFVWSNFYRRSFIEVNRIKMSSLVIGEDMLFNLDAYIPASHVKIVDTCIYRYTVSKSQITKRRDCATMIKAVNGYLQFFDKINNYAHAIPSSKQSLDRIKNQQLFPCFSRALCAGLDKKGFQSFKNRLCSLKMLPVAPVSLSCRFVNLVTKNYLSFRFASLIYSKFFVPLILPHLPRN